MSEDEKFMRLAIARAQEGVAQGQTPFGACIVKDNEVISCEHNVVFNETDITAHAEIHAIRVACHKLKTIDLSGCIIYSTCEPCPMCFSACHWARISRIVYGAGIADAQSGGFNELSISNIQLQELGNSPVALTADFLKEENVQLFKDWGKNTGRQVY